MKHKIRIILIWITATIGGICIFSFLFPFLLGLKIIRNTLSTSGSDYWIVFEVMLASITVTITLTGAVLIFYNRTISGRFFFIAMCFGALLIVLATVVGIRPIKIAFELKINIWLRLIFGNIMIILSNIVSFYTKLPSLL